MCAVWRDSHKSGEGNIRLSCVLKGTSEGEDIDTEIANLEAVVDHVTEEATGIADELVVEKSELLRQRLWEKEAALERAKAELKALRVKRNTEVAPFVYRRLLSLWEALRRKPFSVSEVNKALKEAVSKIVFDPEEGRLWVYWHHHEGEPTDGGPFYSRHSTVFDDREAHGCGAVSVKTLHSI